MWCDRVLGNVASYAPREWDFVDVEWSECGRSLDRTSRGGRRARVLLPPGQRFGHGDVLFDDGQRAVVVDVTESEVLAVRPPTPRLLALLTLELGNLHWPTEISDAGEVIFPEDGPALAVLEKLGLTPTRESRRFSPVPNPVGVTVGLASGFTVTRS